MAQKIQIRRGEKKDLPELNEAEFAMTTDTKEVYIGSDAGNQQLAKVGDIPALDGLETVAGSRSKADAAEQNAKDYTDAQIALIPDVDTSNLATKTELNGKQDKVTISSAVNSTSTTQVANSNAVKIAMDRADAAFMQANDGKTAVANAVTAKGVPASPSDTFPMLATKIGQISTGLLLLPALPGNITLLESLAEYPAGSTWITSVDYTEMKEVKVNFAGIVRVSFKLRSQGSGGVYGRVYINGAAKGIERLGINSIYTEDIAVKSGDSVQIRARANSGLGARVSEFKIGIGLPAYNYGTVIM